MIVSVKLNFTDIIICLVPITVIVVAVIPTYLSLILNIIICVIAVNATVSIIIKVCVIVIFLSYYFCVLVFSHYSKEKLA